MKKILLSLCLFMFATNVYAADFTTKITGNNDFSNTITLEVKVDGFNGISGSCNGLCGFSANINYDSSKIKLDSMAAMNDFDLTIGNKILLIKNNGVSNGTSILKLTFSNLALAVDEQTTITINNVLGSDGSNDFAGVSSTKTIKYIKEVVTTPKKSTTKTTTKSKTVANKVAQSSNSTLSNIEISNGNITFDKNIYSYNIVVDNNVESINITAIAEDDKATIEGIGNKTLAIGTNTFMIKVVAENGDFKEYTLNITRDAADNEIDLQENNVIEDEKDNKSKYTIALFSITGLAVAGGIIYILTRKRK